MTVYEAKAKAKKGVESLKTYMDGVGLRCVKTLAIYVANAQKDDPKCVVACTDAFLLGLVGGD